MSPRKRSPKNKFSLKDKLSAINRVCVNGETKASVARDINAPESTLRGWCKDKQKIIAQLNTRYNPICHQAWETTSANNNENMLRYPPNALRVPRLHQDSRAGEDFEAGPAPQQPGIKENLIAAAETTTTATATSKAEATAMAAAAAAVAAINSIINRIYTLPLTSRNNSDMIEVVNEVNRQLREDQTTEPRNFFETLIMCTQFNRLLYSYGDLISSSNERAIINKHVEDMRKWYMNSQKLRKKSRRRRRRQRLHQ